MTPSESVAIPRSQLMDMVLTLEKAQVEVNATRREHAIFWVQDALRGYLEAVPEVVAEAPPEMDSGAAG